MQPSGPPSAQMRVVTGATVAAMSDWRQFAGQRIGLITNQTGRAGNLHIVDSLAASPSVRLAALFGPEHGVRGTVEAGANIGNARDPRTGVQQFSLYGATRKPTPEMLRGLDVLMFDIQDVGVRSYTYISTMGLAMQAAAAAGLPFVVLDRPNPLSGIAVAGFTLEPAHRSFVGQYPIPITHGMTVGELATMIKGEHWLPGLQSLRLSIVQTTGWSRTMMWPDTGLPWIATSPNIPTFASALTYPGIGIVGTTRVNEGCGTPAPFTQFGAPWIPAAATASSLNAAQLPGVQFLPAAYTPQSIPNVAPNPQFKGQNIGGVRIVVTDATRYRPVDVGVHVLAVLQRHATAQNTDLFGALPMFHAIAGTRRLHQMVTADAPGREIVAAWTADAEAFKQRRAKYLLY